MKHGKRLALIMILASSALNAAPTRLTNYSDLIAALKNGHRVTSITEFKKCTKTGQSKAPILTQDEFDSVGIGFHQGFFLIAKLKNDSQYHVGAIATNTIPGLSDETINRYKRIRVFEDNTVTTTAISSNAMNSKTLGWVEYTCKISLGNDQNGVGLFDYDAN